MDVYSIMRLSIGDPSQNSQQAEHAVHRKSAAAENKFKAYVSLHKYDG